MCSRYLATTHRLTNPQVIIITGANTGLGLEAARHIARLNAAKIILGVRSVAKGEAAKADIERTTGHTGIIEVHEVDLGSYASVQRFAAAMVREPRLDALLANAGMAVAEFTLLEGNESTLTVNVLSTMLLAILLLPALRRSADAHGSVPVVSFVSSGTHAFYSLPEWEADGVFRALNDPKTANMQTRYRSPAHCSPLLSSPLTPHLAPEADRSPFPDCSYPVSKLVHLFLARELAQRIRPHPAITVNSVAPGLCHSSLDRNITGELKAELTERKAKFARSTEAGSRTLVHALVAGEGSTGRYLNDCEVQECVSPFLSVPFLPLSFRLRRSFRDGRHGLCVADGAGS
jgi:NAD(P)-dependent dehydrogenase (short-subunit alcohol dehydrogenase family)